MPSRIGQVEATRNVNFYLKQGLNAIQKEFGLETLKKHPEVISQLLAAYVQACSIEFFTFMLTDRIESFQNCVASFLENDENEEKDMVEPNFGPVQWNATRLGDLRPTDEDGLSESQILRKRRRELIKQFGKKQ